MVTTSSPPAMRRPAITALCSPTLRASAAYTTVSGWLATRSKQTCSLSSGLASFTRTISSGTPARASMSPSTSVARVGAPLYTGITTESVGAVVPNDGFTDSGSLETPVLGCKPTNMGQGMPPSRQKISLVPPASLLKSHDSIVAVLFAGRVARLLVPLARRAEISPNQVTLASVGLTLLAALLVAFGQRTAWIVAATL